MMKSKTPQYLKSIFLTQFNVLDLLFGDFLDVDLHTQCFYDYARICKINDEAWLSEVYENINHEIIQCASTQSEYNMVMRGFVFYPDRGDDMVRMIAEHREVAHQIKNNYFNDDYQVTEEDTAMRLLRAARMGNTDCIALAAYLMDKGYFLKQNAAKTDRFLSNLALWNHPFGCLFGLDHDNLRSLCASKLKTAFTGFGLDDSWEYISKNALLENVPTEKLALVMEDRFALEYSKRNIVDNDIVKLVDCRVLAEESLHKILLSEKNIALLKGLPVDIDREEEIVVPSDLFSEAKLSGEDHLKSVWAELMLHSKPAAEKKPILLISHDSDVLCEVENCLKRGFADQVCIVDVSNRVDITFSATIDNPIIYEMNRLGNKNALVIIKNCNMMEERDQEELALFLKMCCKGQSFRQGDLVLSYNGMIPVILSEDVICNELAGECSIHKLPTVSRIEKQAMVLDIFSKKKIEYSLSDLSSDDYAMSFFCTQSTSVISSALDRIIMYETETGGNLHITAAQLKRHMPSATRFRPDLTWR